MRPQRKLFQTETCCDFSGTTESSGDTIPNCRVAGKYCHFPAPFELDVRVSPHPARAFTNAPCGARSCPSFLHVDLSMTVGANKGDVLNCCGKMPSLRRARLPGSFNLPKQL